MKFKKGDIVRFLPEYEDGKDEFNYVLLEDPDGGVGFPEVGPNKIRV